MRDNQDKSVHRQGKGIHLLLATVAGLVTSVHASSAEACSCQRSEFDPARDFRESDAIFIGTVVKAETWRLQDHSLGFEPVRTTGVVSMNWYTFDVEVAWSGPAITRIAAYSGPSASCGAYFELGDRVLIQGVYSARQYAHIPELNGRLYLDRCVPFANLSLEKITEDISELIPPMQLVEIPDDDRSLSLPRTSQNGKAFPGRWVFRYGYLFCLVLPLGWILYSRRLASVTTCTLCYQASYEKTAHRDFHRQD